jgi:NAD(P)H-hydrate epimerase
MKIVTATQMQTLDRRTIAEAQVPSLLLMERAGSGTADFIRDRFGPLAGKRVTIVCGKGNNGGDGLVVARLLRRHRAIVTVLLLAPPADLSRDAKVMYRRWLRAGGTATKAFRSADHVQSLFANSELIVDALFGTGLSTPVSGAYGEAIRLMNESGRAIVAVDMPSGIHADDGALLGCAVRASATVTFGLPKLGLYLGAGIDHAGFIHVVDIGIPAAYVNQVDSRILLITKEFVKSVLPRRPVSSHKGTSVMWEFSPDRRARRAPPRWPLTPHFEPVPAW